MDLEARRAPLLRRRAHASTVRYVKAPTVIVLLAGVVRVSRSLRERERQVVRKRGTYYFVAGYSAPTFSDSIAAVLVLGESESIYTNVSYRGRFPTCCSWLAERKSATRRARAIRIETISPLGFVSYADAIVRYARAFHDRADRRYQFYSERSNLLLAKLVIYFFYFLLLVVAAVPQRVIGFFSFSCT